MSCFFFFVPKLEYKVMKSGYGWYAEFNSSKQYETVIGHTCDIQKQEQEKKNHEQVNWSCTAQTKTAI